MSFEFGVLIVLLLCIIWCEVFNLFVCLVFRFCLVVLLLVVGFLIALP